jgi:ATP-dependent Clp protease ATP-binding subunit ClpA
MFERFTDRARRVVVLAQEEARMLNHNYIGTEHILLGLIHEGEGVAARALESLGISLQAVRLQVEEIIGQGHEAQSGHIPFTPRAKKVLELALRECQQLGHVNIGTEHLLLGLVREGEGVAAQVLVRLGADLNRVRQQVIATLREHGGETAPEAGPRRGGPRSGHGDLGERLDEALARLGAIESRLARIDSRLTHIDSGLARIDGRLARVGGPGVEVASGEYVASDVEVASGDTVPGDEPAAGGEAGGREPGEGEPGGGDAAAGGLP